MSMPKISSAISSCIANLQIKSQGLSNNMLKNSIKSSDSISKFIKSEYCIPQDKFVKMTDLEITNFLCR